MDPMGSMGFPFFQATSSINPAKKRKTDLVSQEINCNSTVLRVIRCSSSTVLQVVVGNLHPFMCLI